MEKRILKADLLSQARIVYPSPKYEIQKMADKFESGIFSIKILFLRVAHIELNAIEMFWARVKRNAAKRNFTFP